MPDGSQLRNGKRADAGYAVDERVFDRAEMARALEALGHAGLVRSRAGARHVLSAPIVRDLASDPRLVRIARRFIGADPVPFRATLFDKSKDSNWLVAWHQDTALPASESRR